MTMFPARRRPDGARRAGDRARDAGRWSEAAAHYRLWLAEAPADFAIRVQLGHMLAEAGAHDAADAEYAAAEALRGDDADLALCRGHLARRRGDMETARHYYARAVAIGGDARADAALAALPAPEPDAEPEPEMPPAPIGLLEGWYDREVTGWVHGEPGTVPTVEFRVGDRIVGRAAADLARADASEHGFRATLALEGEVATVSAFVLPGGAEIANSPVILYPLPAPELAPEPEPEPEPGDAAPVGRLESWYDREIAGVVHAEPGIAPEIEFRVGDRVVGRVRARLPREAADERGFRAVVDIEGGATEVSVLLMPEGRALEGSPVLLHPIATRPRDDAPRAWSAHAITAKPFAMPASGEVALLVAHAPMGRVKPHVAATVRALADEGVATLLIVVADRPVAFAPGELDAVAGAIVRENLGYDFAAWSHALRLHPELYGARLLLLTNDSVFASADRSRLAATLDRVRGSAAALVGLTESHEYGWHVQSYFLACKPELLSSWAFHLFMEDVRILGSKDEIVRAYEVPFAGRMERAGFAVETLFASHLAVNPALFGWRELLAAGFPFVKLLLVRGQFPEVDLAGWRETLAERGFDLALLDATIAAAQERGPASGDADLLARPYQPRPGGPARPTRVAYFGPWNYDNGLGQASRELLGALQRTGCALNVHPIHKPFHVHRPVAPAVDSRDFTSAPDIAIVHLNPDSWHLLTDEQRGVIASAGRRIGYWVWEMDRLPPAWAAEFDAVDRIWAPSRFCAEVFARTARVPVDVIPHPVPVLPADAAVDRAAVLGAAGVDPAHRVILYVFDGSSYLVRKNPAALVRAFDAAGLAARGWTLLLKTKHLHDRPEAGTALAALVDETPGAVLLDRAMTPEALRALMSVADVYASPHCAEGFGLTVAEAMAAGRIVVATDYSGTADLLTAATGFPVPAHRWVLGEDHGHYLRGSGWARIDEPALAAALLRAAEAAERGDGAIGATARAAVAERLSYAAVGRAIAASIAATGAGEPAGAAIHPEVDPMRGPRFAECLTEEGVVPVPLAADGLPAAMVPAGEDGDWLVLAPGDAGYALDIAEIVRAQAAARPDVALFYGDDVAAAAAPQDRLRIKPELDRTLLVAQDYVGAPVIVRRAAYRALGGLDASRGSAALYDLVLRATVAGVAIGRIPRVLIAHDGARTAATAEQRRAAIEALPAFAGHDVRPGRAPGLLALSRRWGDDAPAVSIIVPTCRTRIGEGDRTYVERLLEGIAEADWPLARLTVIVGDDGEGSPDWARRSWPFALRHVPTPRAAGEPFNFAAKMNRLWRLAEDEQIVFLNDDVLPVGTGWLRALQTFAVDGSVGAVGARLLYEDGRIQHAGVAPAFRTVGHLWLGWPADRPTYQHWAEAQREWSMVTGAVLATRRSLLDRVDGFDERFSLEFNDIDLCLRLRRLGLRIVYNPDAEMIHAEKVSRGHRAPPGAEVALFRSRWREWLVRDPSFHPHHADDRLGLAAVPQPGDWYR